MYRAGPGSCQLASAPGCVSFIHLTSEARRRDESACRHKAGHVVSSLACIETGGNLAI